MLLLWVGSTEIFIHSSKVRLYLQDRDGWKFVQQFVSKSSKGCAAQGLCRAPTGRETVSMQVKSQGVRVTVRVSGSLAGSSKVR